MFVIARGILRHLLAGYTGEVPSNINFSYGKYGKPFLVSSSTVRPIYFNLSHSGDMIAYAISLDQEIGVDIERIQPNIVDDGLIQLVLSPKERVEFDQLPIDQQLLAFFRLWVCKESILKAMGCGLSYSLLGVEMRLDPDCFSLVRLEGESEASNKWTVQEFNAIVEYTGAVSVATNEKQNISHAWVTDEVLLETIIN